MKDENKEAAKGQNNEAIVPAKKGEKLVLHEMKFEESNLSIEERFNLISDLKRSF